MVSLPPTFPSLHMFFFGYMHLFYCFYDFSTGSSSKDREQWDFLTGMCVIYSFFFLLSSFFFLLSSFFFLLCFCSLSLYSYFLFLISYFLFSFNSHSLFPTPPSQQKQTILSSSSLWHPLFCCSLFSFPHCSHL